MGWRKKDGAIEWQAPVLASVGEAFDPQARILMAQDVEGYLGDKRENVKYHLRAGEAYYIDVDTAAEFITKGYAVGELPREVSEAEEERWLAQKTIVRPGG